MEKKSKSNKYYFWWGCTLAGLAAISVGIASKNSFYALGMFWGIAAIGLYKKADQRGEGF